MRQTFRILVTGSRSWDDIAVIEHALAVILARHPEGVLLVHGACPRGADAIAAAYAGPDTGITHRGASGGLAAPWPGRRAAPEREDDRLGR
jgi:YspA, cpYpsA-related SLOG family